MAWFRTDDRFFYHRKVRALPKRCQLAAIGLWSLCGSWCQSEHAPGTVPEYIARDLGGTEHIIDALVNAGLWHAPGHSCPSCPPIEAGYVFHQWDQWQDQKRADETRAANAERQRNKRERDRERAQDTASGNADGTQSEDVTGTDRPRTEPADDTEVRRGPLDVGKLANVTCDSDSDSHVALDPALPSPAQPGSSIEEPPPLPSPTQPADQPGQTGRDGAGQGDEQVPDAGADRATGDVVAQLRSQYGARARDVERWFTRLTPEYGQDGAREILERALADPETRTLGRLDPKTGSNYLYDLARAMKADQQAHRQRTGARCPEHPGHLADSCGACRADRLVSGQERPIGAHSMAAAS